ncbi:S8 family serine peptidase [Flavobacterium sp.]|uniref:S8 family serine peptidase n=1 Tax=Flavobacterium sp. TaxID=239 RepID=UPI00286C9648|nr:S8 family serine peptidase [Flavobacterium sp.]
MKNIYLLFLIALNFSAVAQEDAWVYFNAKPNAQYYYDNPLQMLSQRALDRRTTQNISLDIKDVPLHQPYVDQITASTGISVMAKSKWLNALHIRGTQANIASLTSLSFVEKVVYANHSLNPSNRIAPKLEKNNVVNKFQDIQVSFNYGNSATQVQMLNAHILHQQNYTGAGKIIAIMDAGFPGVNSTAPFQRLRTNNLILGGYDFVNNTTNPYTGNSHGTLVLSDMGGYVDNQLIGTAPDAQYYLFITEDTNSETPLEESNWVEAAEMADSLGVDVINTSLGYFTYDNPNYSYTYNDMNGTKSFISRGADVAFSRGMICVTSAGNSGSSSDPYIAVPADAFTTLTVGAVNSAKVKASFSSIGPTFDGRLKPDVMAMGASATVANQSGSVVTASGTSFSSPIMAGAVTSFWSAFPNKTNAEIVQLVKASADRYSNPNSQYGNGIPDFKLALNNSTSLSESNNSNVNLYPNPALNFITISTQESLKEGTIIFYNNLGQIVLKEKLTNSQQNISLQSLPNGIYHYNIVSTDKILNGKIIKN